MMMILLVIIIIVVVTIINIIITISIIITVVVVVIFTIIIIIIIIITRANNVYQCGLSMLSFRCHDRADCPDQGRGQSEAAPAGNVRTDLIVFPRQGGVERN